MVGGRSEAYEKKLGESREIALKEMSPKAEALGADASSVSTPTTRSSAAT
jgi:uncharacterized protein YbjQ (UPF0145 family)